MPGVLKRIYLYIIIFLRKWFIARNIIYEYDDVNVIKKEWHFVLVKWLNKKPRNLQLLRFEALAAIPEKWCKKTQPSASARESNFLSFWLQ